MKQIFRLNFLLISLTVIAFFQCKKVNETETGYHLSVDKIFPNIGTSGTLVNISGKGYSLILTEDTVWFNGTPAQIKMVTDTSIQVYAPGNNSTGIVTVSVRGKVIDGPVFTYVQNDEPAITSIDPEVGWDYTMNSVTLRGFNFGNDRNKVSVLFDTIVASLQFFSDTSLIVSPPQHTAGKVPVVVIVDGKRSNTVYYTYQNDDPLITNITTRQRAPYVIGGGDTVTITGKYFGAQSQTSVVEIWGPVTLVVHYTPDPAILSWSDTEVRIVVPNYNISDGLQIQLKLKENGKEADTLVTYYKQAQAGGTKDCLILGESGNDPNQRPFIYEFDNSGKVRLVKVYQQGYLFDSTIVSADQILERSADGQSSFRTVYLQKDGTQANIYEKQPDSAIVYRIYPSNEVVFEHFRFLYDNINRLSQVIKYNDNNSYYTYMYISYDNKGNLTQLRYTSPLELNYPEVTLSCTAYDDKQSPFHLIKYGAFLSARDYSYPDMLFFKLSKNNPLNYIGSDFSNQYSYQYNANGYPLVQAEHYQSGAYSFYYTQTYSYQCQ